MSQTFLRQPLRASIVLAGMHLVAATTVVAQSTTMTPMPAPDVTAVARDIVAAQKEVLKESLERGDDPSTLLRRIAAVEATKLDEFKRQLREEYHLVRMTISQTVTARRGAKSVSDGPFESPSKGSFVWRLDPADPRWLCVSHHVERLHIAGRARYLVSLTEVPSTDGYVEFRATLHKPFNFLHIGKDRPIWTFPCVAVFRLREEHIEPLLTAAAHSVKDALVAVR